MSFTPRIDPVTRKPCCRSYANGYGTGEPLPPSNPCAKCRAHVAQNLTSLQENPMKNLEAYTPPSPYEAELAVLRAASATPMSRFEERFAAERAADFKRQHATFSTFRAAQQPAPRTTDAALVRYAPIDPYGPALRALKEGR